MLHKILQGAPYKWQEHSVLLHLPYCFLLISVYLVLALLLQTGQFVFRFRRYHVPSRTLENTVAYKGPEI